MTAGPLMSTGEPFPSQAMDSSPPRVATRTGESSRPRRMPATAAAQHAAASASLLPSGADRLLDADGEKERAALLCALEEHRLDDVDRALLRRIVEKVLVHEGPRLEVVMR